MAACGTRGKFLAEVRKGQENGTNFFLVPTKNLIGRFSFSLQGIPLRLTSSLPFIDKAAERQQGSVAVPSTQVTLKLSDQGGSKRGTGVGGLWGEGHQHPICVRKALWVTPKCLCSHP